MVPTVLSLFKEIKSVQIQVVSTVLSLFAEIKSVQVHVVPTVLLLFIEIKPVLVQAASINLSLLSGDYISPDIYWTWPYIKI